MDVHHFDLRFIRKENSTGPASSFIAIHRLIRAAMESDTATEDVSKSKVHLLLERLELPLLGQRVFFTCIDVNNHLIACGANTGSVYLCERRENLSGRGDLHKLHLVDTTASVGEPVTQVAFSLDGKKLALSSESGTIRIIKLNMGSLRQKQEILQTSTAHKGSQVTSLKWDFDGSRIFAGDRKGVVSCIAEKSSVTSIFSTPDILFRGNSAIVQIDFQIFGSIPFLLVSSKSRCVIFSVQSTRGNEKKSGIEHPIQIGKKKRDGLFGACFCDPDDPGARTLLESMKSSVPSSVPDNKGGDLKSLISASSPDTQSDQSTFPPKEETEFLLYAARPGRRIWLANGYSQQVLCTLKPVLEMRQTSFNSPTNSFPVDTPILEFNKLLPFRSSIGVDFKGVQPLLLSWNATAVFLINTDMPSFSGARVLQWHVDLGEIHDVALCGANCSENNAAFYVVHGARHSISRIIALQTVPLLHSQYASTMSVEWCVKAAVNNDVKTLSVLQKIHGRLQSTKLSDENFKLVEKFMQLLSEGKSMEPHPTLPYARTKSLPYVVPQSPTPAKPSDLQDLSHFLDVKEIKTKQSKITETEMLALFERLLKDVVTRWKEVTTKGEENAVARRHYRIKCMAQRTDMSVDIPSEIPDNVKSEVDLLKWGEEICLFIRESYSTMGQSMTEIFSEAASAIAGPKKDVNDRTTPTVKRSKRAKRRGHRSSEKLEAADGASGMEKGTAKNKKKRDQRERLASISDLEEADLGFATGQARRMSVLQPRKKLEKRKAIASDGVLDPVKDAISAAAAATKTQASRAIEEIKAEFLKSDHSEQASIDQSLFGETIAEGQLTDLSRPRKVTSKPWKQVRQKKRGDIDTAEIAQLDRYMRRVQNKPADSNKGNDESVLASWFGSSRSATSTNTKLASAGDLRSKRTAHVVYTKIDGLQEVQKLEKASLDTVNAVRSFPSPSLVQAVYNYTSLYLELGYLMSTGKILYAFVKSFVPTSDISIPGGGDVDKPSSDCLDTKGDIEKDKTATALQYGDNVEPRSLTDTENAKAAELVTLYFELRCKNRSENALPTADGEHLISWEESKLESFILSYWKFLNIDRVFLIISERGSSILLRSMQSRLKPGDMGGKHKLFSDAFQRSDTDRMFAYFSHWRSTYYSPLDGVVPIPPLSCLCQSFILSELIASDSKKACSLIVSWYEWMSLWLIMEILNDTREDVVSGSRNGWYRSLFQELLCFDAIDLSGVACKDDPELLRLSFELEINGGNDAFFVEIIKKNRVLSHEWLLETCKRKKYLRGALSLLSEACSRFDTVLVSTLTEMPIPEKVKIKKEGVLVEIEALSIVIIELVYDRLGIAGTKNENDTLKDTFAKLAARCLDVVQNIMKMICFGGLVGKSCEYFDHFMFSIFQGITRGIGARPTIDFIAGFSEELRDYVPKDVYIFLVKTDESEKQRLASVESIMAKLDKYLWKRKDSSLPPQIRALKDAEFEYRYGKSKDLSHLPVSVQNLIKSGGTEGHSTSKDPLPNFFEDAGGHWGVTTSFQRQSETEKVACVGGTSDHPDDNRYNSGDLCPRCGTTYEKGDQIMVFKCGHGTHKLCAREMVCSVCPLLMTSAIAPPSNIVSVSQH